MSTSYVPSEGNHIGNANANQFATRKEEFSYNSFTKSLNEIEYRLRENKNLKTLYDRTRIPIVYMLGAVLFFSLIIVYMFSGIRAITNIIGVIYPFYASLKALQKEDKMEDILWLSYWIWYGLFTMIESITDVFLSWIPMYELMKMGFYVYLYAPNTKGALFLYRKVLEPFIIQLEKYEQQFIKNVYQIKETISDDSITQNSSNTSGSTRLRPTAPTFNPVTGTQ